MAEGAHCLATAITSMRFLSHSTRPSQQLMCPRPVPDSFTLSIDLPRVCHPSPPIAGSSGAVVSRMFYLLLQL